MTSKKSAVWISGASSGIGKAISIEFAKQGENLILSSRNEQALYTLKEEIDSREISVEVLPLDVSKADEIQSQYSKISQSYFIDCLINNAGVTSFALAEKTSLEECKVIIDTNLLGAIYMIKTVMTEMMEKKQGTILNILSVAAQKIFTNSSVYSASKAGLAAYSKVLREEVREYNIKVTDILPGATKTPIWPNEALEKFSERMMSPDDIAKIVYNAYSNNSSLVPEEIVLRPIKGDL